MAVNIRKLANMTSVWLIRWEKGVIQPSPLLRTGCLKTCQYPATRKPRPTKMKIERYPLITVKLPIHTPTTPIENNVKGITQQAEAPMAIRKLPMAVELWTNVFFINIYYHQSREILNGKDVQLTAFTFLNRRTLNTSIRTINTTTSFFRFKFIFAMRTLPKILTILDRHLFNCFLMTSWTCDCRLELDNSHRVLLNFLGFSL